MADLDTATARSGSTLSGDATAEPDPDPGVGTVSATSTDRRGRVGRWDRPPPPHDWRWYVGNTGKILITFGLLIFAFVVYQLYGTGIETAAAQRGLRDDFEQMLAAAPPAPDTDAPALSPDGGSQPTPTTAAPSSADGDDGAVVPAPGDSGPATATVAPVPVAQQRLPSLDEGAALAVLEIPSIGVDDVVVAGVETDDLKNGPGHFPETPLPGQLGNSAIAGHRTTHGQPFRNVDRLQPGDEIRVTTLDGLFVYRVTGTEIVTPDQRDVVVNQDDPTTAHLTLTSCHPVFTARERIVIFSELDVAASAPVGAPLINDGRPVASDSGAGVPDEIDATATVGSAIPATLPADVAGDQSNDVPGVLPGDGRADGGSDAAGDPASADPGVVSSDAQDPTDDAFSQGWFSDPAANPQVALWGLALSAIAIGAYLLSRRVRRNWVGLVVGIAPFVVTLYFFFQNVNRLLPPNL